MKNLVLTALLAFFTAQVAFAQIPNSAYHVAPNPVDTITAMDEYDSPAHAEVSNTTNDSIYVKWVRHIVSITPGIETAVCDPKQCWFPSVDTKIFGLPAQGAGELTVHFYNSTGQAASGIVHLELTNQANPADVLTAVFTYSTLTGTGELPEPVVKLFPNPTVDFFTLENTTDVASMRLFALDGREVARFNPSANNTYSIADQPLGTYVLSIEDKNGNMFQAIEVVKR